MHISFYLKTYDTITQMSYYEPNSSRLNIIWIRALEFD